MDKIYVVSVMLVAMAVSVPFVMGPLADDYCCQGPGCPVCDPFFIPDPPPPADDPIGPPSPPDGWWEKIYMWLQDAGSDGYGGGFSNDLFWWLRK